MKAVQAVLITLLLLFLAPLAAGAEGFSVYIGKVPPFTYLDKSGIARGAAVDVVAELMETAGEPIRKEAIKSISWARAVEDVETTPGTMIFGMARTPQRENKFKWVGPIAELNLGLVAEKRRHLVIRRKEDVKQYRLGVIRNSAPLQILESAYGMHRSNMTLLTNDPSQFKMLKERRVDMITQADTAAPYWLKKESLNPADYEMVHIMKHLKLYVALNWTTEDALINKLQHALDEMKTTRGSGKSRYDTIMESHLGSAPIAVNSQ